MNELEFCFVQGDTGDPGDCGYPGPIVSRQTHFSFKACCCCYCCLNCLIWIALNDVQSHTQSNCCILQGFCGRPGPNGKKGEIGEPGGPVNNCIKRERERERESNSSSPNVPMFGMKCDFKNI